MNVTLLRKSRSRLPLRLLPLMLCVLLCASILFGCAIPREATPFSRSGFYFDTVITITVYDEKDLKSLGEINAELVKPIVHNDQTTIYAEKPEYSPVNSPFKELNNPAIKNIEVCLL